MRDFFDVLLVGQESVVVVARCRSRRAGQLAAFTSASSACSVSFHGPYFAGLKICTSSIVLLSGATCADVEDVAGIGILAEKLRFDGERIGVIDDLVETCASIGRPRRARPIRSWSTRCRNIAKPKISGDSAIRVTGTPAVRIAVTSLSPIRRPIASSAANRHANGNAIGIACGIRNSTKRSTERTARAD